MTRKLLVSVSNIYIIIVIINGIFVLVGKLIQSGVCVVHVGLLVSWNRFIMQFCCFDDVDKTINSKTINSINYVV